MKNPRNWNIGNHRKQVEELRQTLKNINIHFKNSNQYQYTNLRRNAATLIKLHLHENLGLTNLHQSVMEKLNRVKKEKRRKNMNAIQRLQQNIKNSQRLLNSGANIKSGGQANKIGRAHV